MFDRSESPRHDALSPSALQLQTTAKDVGTAYARAVEARRERDGAYDALISKLHAITALRHGETGQHIVRVGALAAHLAKLAGQSEHYCATINRAAPLHDVGKILIPDHILQKPAALSDSERSVMAMHVEAGVLLLDGAVHPVLAMAKEIAQFHHERWDGKGYPQQLCAHDIPLCARITAIVDVFDAVSIRTLASSDGENRARSLEGVVQSPGVRRLRWALMGWQVYTKAVVRQSAPGHAPSRTIMKRALSPRVGKRGVVAGIKPRFTRSAIPPRATCTPETAVQVKPTGAASPDARGSLRIQD